MWYRDTITVANVNDSDKLNSYPRVFAMQLYEQYVRQYNGKSSGASAVVSIMMTAQYNLAYSNGYSL